MRDEEEKAGGKGGVVVAVMVLVWGGRKEVRWIQTKEDRASCTATKQDVRV